MKNKSNIWIIAISALVVINLLLIGIVWNGHQQLHKDHAPRPDLRVQRQLSVLDRNLRLTADQQALFKDAFRTHHQTMQSLDQKEQQVSMQLHQAVFNHDELSIDSLKLVVQSIALERTEAAISFTRQLADQCSPDQQAALMELLKRMQRPGSPGPEGMRGRQEVPRPDR